MAGKAFTTEIDRARARPDANDLLKVVEAYEDYFVATGGDGDWPDAWAELFGELIFGFADDADRTLAFVVLSGFRMADPACLGVVSCGPLENLLSQPSEELLKRIIAEARKSARFRWMLSHPFKVAVSDAAWSAIEKFRITGPHEEPADDTMPESYFA